MKILIDIGHPAHVHFYRNFIQRMNGSTEIVITAREKDIATTLLDLYNLKYFSRGKGSNTVVGKCLYLIKAVLFLSKIIRKENIDILTGINNPYVAIAGFLNGKKSLVFNDTEGARTAVNIVKRFCTRLYTPSCYLVEEGAKQIRYNGFHELAYLHPFYFKPDKTVLEKVGLKEGEKFVVMRFVALHALHDIGHRGLSIKMKRKAVEKISRYARVFITSEEELPPDLEKYKAQISPEWMHHLLYYATLYFGDGGTMASEAALLGTPAINIASSADDIGTFAEFQKYGLMYIFRNENQALEKSLELLKDPQLTEKARKQREQVLASKIDVTEFTKSLFSETGYN
ncbi:DUF354 domain-containing protein [candidate division KSB1 bacterium]|nr:DUF354 domain-containing protein [candidate division KSB1 bacterium]